MNMLSSNERPGTGSATHSSIGEPLAPNPLNRSSEPRTSERRIRSVVGAAVICAFEPATEFGRVARKPSAPTTKDITTIILSDFMYFFSFGLGPVGDPIGKGFF